MLEVLLEYVRIVEELRTFFSHEASICYGYRVPSTANRYRVCDDAHTTRPFRIHIVVMGSDQASQPRGQKNSGCRQFEEIADNLDKEQPWIRQAIFQL